MDSTERIVLQEMRRAIEQRQASGQLDNPEGVDFTVLTDGELLKCLRAAEGWSLLMPSRS
jgi:hypothetical protein